VSLAILKTHVVGNDNLLPKSIQLINQVRAGEIAQSARSITSSLLRRLYDFNFSFPIYRLGEVPQDVVGNDYRWGGGRLRLMLQCIYTVAFLCLLRFDEVLKIQAHHLEVVDEASGEIMLSLPFRKTHKYGGNPKALSLLTTLEIKPFHLFHNLKERHLDATHMILCWMRECRITEGYLFRRFLAEDRISPENKPLV